MFSVDLLPHPQLFTSIKGITITLPLPRKPAIRSHLYNALEYCCFMDLPFYIK